jgi:glucan-binding YG repeat protein
MKLTTGRPSRRKKLPYEATQVQFETDLDGVIVRSELVDAIVITKVFARDCVQKANDSNAAYRKEIRVKNQEVESGQQKNSTKAQSANGKKPRPAATSPEEHQHSNFDQFQSAYLQHKINFAPKDWEAARSTWNILELSDQLAAVKGISDRFEQGEYDPRAPQWIPFPQNYLKDSLWKRTVRPGKKPAGKVKVYKDDTTAFAALDLARRMDQKIAGKR